MTNPYPEERDYFTDLSVLEDPNEYFRNIFRQDQFHQITGKDYLITEE
jgi:hypothetical protein